MLYLAKKRQNRETYLKHRMADLSTNQYTDNQSDIIHKKDLEYKVVTNK